MESGLNDALRTQGGSCAKVPPLMSRRFPPLWQVHQVPGGFKVLDANGQALVYVDARETPEQANIARTLTVDEARRIAVNVAGLPNRLSFWQCSYNERLRGGVQLRSLSACTAGIPSCPQACLD